jgi:hypothetical protein
MSNISEFNDNYKFILTVIDCFSRFAFAVPCRNKGGEQITQRFTEILATSQRKPLKLQIDKGKEFLNSRFQNLLQENNIKHFTTENETKAAFVERFNRTIKTKLYRYFTANNTYRYLDVFDKLVAAYNKSKHSATGYAPIDVNAENENQIWTHLYLTEKRTQRAPQFKVKQKVRIQEKKHIMQKGYEPNWTEEFFEITETQPHGGRVLYKLKDTKGEEVTGRFYPEEIQKIEKSDQDKYLIDKVITSKKVHGKKYLLVSWKGWPASYNSWIPETELSTNVARH